MVSENFLHQDILKPLVECTIEAQLNMLACLSSDSLTASAAYTAYKCTYAFGPAVLVSLCINKKSTLYILYIF